MALRILGVRGSVLASMAILVLGWAGVACGQGGPPTVQASSELVAQSLQRMDTTSLPGFNQNVAAVSDSYVGPISFGGQTQGSADTSVSASATAGIIKLFTHLECTALPNGTGGGVSASATVEGKFADTLTVTQGQGNIIAGYLPNPVSAGLPITGQGNSWVGDLELRISINVISTGGMVARYSMAASYSQSNLGLTTHETGAVQMPVRLHDEVTVDVDETLYTSISALSGGSSGVLADLSHTTHLLFQPVSAGVSFAAESGHSYLPGVGDANADGVVNFSDLLTLAQNYGHTTASWAQGDFNGDGAVNFDDLLLLAQHYGQTTSSSQLAQLSPSVRHDVERAFAAVPEPASLAVLVAAIPLARKNRRG